MNERYNAKPSQAEGEDPDRDDEGRVIPTEGHPSQAEGEDDVDTGGAEADQGDAENEGDEGAVGHA